MNEKPRILNIAYVCQHCGKEFHPKKPDRNKYCSRECAFAHKAAKPKERKNPICVVCGKEFSGRAGRKYCSEECRKEHDRQRASVYWRERKCAAVVNESVTKRCKCCGKLFETSFMANIKEYCSSRCIVT